MSFDQLTSPSSTPRMKLSLSLLTVLNVIVALPRPPQHTWDPEGIAEMEAYTNFIDHLRKSINEGNWKEVDPKDFIAHDKFNIADGFGVDVFSVEAMQEAGDPVIAVEKEMSRKRGDAERNERKRGWLGLMN